MILLNGFDKICIGTYVYVLHTKKEFLINLIEKNTKVSISLFCIWKFLDSGRWQYFQNKFKQFTALSQVL